MHSFTAWHSALKE